MCTERWVTVKSKNDRLVPCLHCYFSIRNQTCQKVEIAVVWLWFGRERGMLGQFLLQLKAVEPSRSRSSTICGSKTFLLSHLHKAFFIRPPVEGLLRRPLSRHLSSPVSIPSLSCFRLTEAHVLATGEPRFPPCSARSVDARDIWGPSR